MENYSVFIVDDEPNIREGLPLLIHWEKLGFKIVGSEKNGSDALDRILEKNIDLVISDIKMPGLNGLELMAALKAKGFKGYFIVISGYNEFSLAQESLNLGVESYLLKPIEEDCLKASLIKVKEKIEKKAQDNSIMKRLYLNNCLKKIVLYPSGGDELLRFIEAAGCQFQCEYNLCIIDIITIPGEGCAEDYIDAFLGDIKVGIFRISNSRLVLFIPAKALHEFKDSIRYFSLKLVLFLSEKLDVFLSISKKFRSIDNIKLAYQTALTASRYIIYRDNNTVIDYRDISNQELRDDFKEPQKLAVLKDYLFNDHFTDWDSLIEELIDQCLDLRLTYVRIIFFLNEKMTTLKEKLSSEFPSYAEIYKILECLSNPLYKISRTVFFSSLKELALLIQSNIQSQKNNSCKGIAGKVQEYIGAHYKEDLKLNLIAEIFHVNASYLGSLFKQNIGLSFNQYLNDLRLKESLELLRNTDKKIYEIGLLVGYKESSYFLSCFEKKYLTSPSKFRSSL